MFSSFATGWPGVGLLVLRLTLSSFLLHLLATSASLGFPETLITFSALLVATGLWTPLAGVLAAFCLVWNGVANNHLWPCLAAAALGIAVSLIGPGALSIDAYRFGRKRVIFDDRGE